MGIQGIGIPLQRDSASDDTYDGRGDRSYAGGRAEDICVCFRTPVYAMIENIGFEKGIEKGLVQGMEQGIEKGIQSGSSQARIATARALLRKGKLSFEEIAEVTELTVSEGQNLV